MVNFKPPMFNYYFVSPLTKDQARKHFHKLDQRSLYTRFCRDMTPEMINQYVEEAKGSFYGVILFGEDVPVAVVHFISDRSCWTKENNVAEIGFSTLPGFQGRGFGRVLMMFAKGLAEVGCVDTIVMSGLANNKPIQKLARDAGFNVVTDYDEFDAQVKTFRNACKMLGKSAVQFISAPLAHWTKDAN